MPRREFLTTSAGRRAGRERDRQRAARRSSVGAGESAAEAAAAASSPESLVKVLFETLSPKQREAICFAWDHKDEERGLLRTRVANNWDITENYINDNDFYTKDQQAIIRKIFEGIISPEWHERIDKQLDGRCGRLRRAEQHRHLRRAGQRASSSS